MADNEITALTAATTSVEDDVFVIVTDTSTTPVTKKITKANLPFALPPYKITPSISSNDIVLTLTHLDGTTPSASRPLYFEIGTTKRSVTAALSRTLADGTNWFNAGSAELGTKEMDLFPYVVWDSNSSAVGLTFARIPYARLISEFSSTTTNEKYCAGYSDFTSTDECVNIGRFAATLSLSGTSHLWTTPTATNANLRHTPTFETRELDWTPTLSRSTTGYTNVPTLTYANYQIIGKRLFYSTTYAMHATTPGGSGYQTVTLPFQATQNASGTGFNLTDAYALAIFVAASTLAGLRLFKYDGTAEAVAAKTYGAWGNYRL